MLLIIFASAAAFHKPNLVMQQRACPTMYLERERQPVVGVLCRNGVHRRTRADVCGRSPTASPIKAFDSVERPHLQYRPASATPSAVWTAHHTVTQRCYLSSESGLAPEPWSSSRPATWHGQVGLRRMTQRRYERACCTCRRPAGGVRPPGHIMPATQYCKVLSEESELSL